MKDRAHADGARAAPREWAVVALLALLAFALRAWSLDFALPAAIEDDSGVLVRQIEMVRDATPAAERDENWGLYPHLVAELAGRVAPDDAPRAADDTVEELRTRANTTHVHARAAVMLLGLLAIPLAWLVARRFVGRGAALLAAALVSTSLLFQCFSQEARPHAAAAATALLALWAALRLVERGDVPAFLVLGVSGGLAVGTLQDNVLVLVPILIACALRTRGPGRAHGAWTLATVALVAGGWWLFNAHGGTGGPLVQMDAAKRTLRLFGHNVVLGEFDASGFATVFWSLWSFETVACVLALAGLVVWLARIRGRIDRHDWFGQPELFLVVAWSALHLVAIGMYARTFERFCLQFVPILCVLAAWGAERIVARARWSRFVLAAGWIAMALVPAARFAALRAEPIAQDQAGAWLAANAKRDERIALHPLTDVPLLRTKEALAGDARHFTMPWRGFTPWRRYQERIAEELLPNERFDVRPLMRAKDYPAFEAAPGEWLAASGARYVVLPLQAIREGPDVFRALRAACRERGELAARFPARADGETDVVLGFEDRIESARPHWTWSLLARAPISVEVLEVWRLR
ncbi:MAG: glycosyltransferase family 39 protein [Planctomycetes bacterium]|nr:glycosyltransferase family 39 protein [Planctomycetota bacterium]